MHHGGVRLAAYRGGVRACVSAQVAVCSAAQGARDAQVCFAVVNVHHRRRDILLLDRGQPMSWTTSQSGENYRDYWPQPCMAEFARFRVFCPTKLER